MFTKQSCLTQVLHRLLPRMQPGFCKQISFQWHTTFAFQLILPKWETWNLKYRIAVKVSTVWNFVNIVLSSNLYWTDPNALKICTVMSFHLTFVIDWRLTGQTWKEVVKGKTVLGHDRCEYATAVLVYILRQDGKIRVYCLQPPGLDFTNYKTLLINCGKPLYSITLCKYEYRLHGIIVQRHILKVVHMTHLHKSPATNHYIYHYI